MKILIGLLLAVAAGVGVVPLSAQEAPPAAAADAAKLAEDLIYAVDRTPERTFDTARDVQVISHDEIVHLNVANVAQLLDRQPGVGVLYGEVGSMPVIRGLGGKQVLILIDGVRINNATWRGETKEYLRTIDVSQIERVEIVRGVVSVLGTESLGGVINIITRKAQSQAGQVGGSLALRYATAEHSFSNQWSFFGSLGNVRFEAGGTFVDAGDIHAGGETGLQNRTGLDETAGHLNGQWLLSADKTISFGYQNARIGDEPTPPLGIEQQGNLTSSLQLAQLRYHDLTSRGWEDSLQVTAYWNKQVDLRNVVYIPLVQEPPIHEHDRDSLGGLNVELNSFFGSHHLVYGLDYSDEASHSGRTTVDAAGGPLELRGNLMERSAYRSSGLYVQDRFDPLSWLTVVGGLRLARYETRGMEDSDFGRFAIDGERTNLTGALNLIAHATPSLNFIANVVDGYRAPNLDDISHFGPSAAFIEIPNPMASPEKVLSVEAGLKFDRDRFTGALFYFDNRFSDLLVQTAALLNGKRYLDINRNGVEDPGEPLIVSTRNVGRATIRGVEADLTYALRDGLSVSGSYARLVGMDEVLHEPLTSMPPASGILNLRYAAGGRHAPWAALDFRIAGAQDRLSPEDRIDPVFAEDEVPGYRVVDLRGGLTLSRHLAVSLGLDNLFDEDYGFIGSDVVRPGRQLVFGVQTHF